MMTLPQAIQYLQNAQDNLFGTEDLYIVKRKTCYYKNALYTVLYGADYYVLYRKDDEWKAGCIWLPSDTTEGIAEHIIHAYAFRDMEWFNMAIDSQDDWKLLSLPAFVAYCHHV